MSMRQYLPSADGDGAEAVPFITNVTGTNVVITWASGTVPASKVVEEFEYDSDYATVTIYGEIDGGPDGFTPTVTIEGAEVTGSPVSCTVTPLGTDTRRYQFNQSVALTDAGTLYLRTADGGEHEITVTQAATAPAITTLTHGSCPGAQTAVKNGDEVDVDATFPAGASYFVVENFELHGTTAVEYEIDVTDTSISDVFTVAGSDHAEHNIKCHLKMAGGKTGDSKESTNMGLAHDSTVPQIASIVVDSYPASQSALKDAEEADCTAVVTDYTSILYSDNATSELTIPATTSYAETKTVARASGGYRESGNNYKIVASKSSNDSSTTAYACVKIAHDSPVVKVYGNTSTSALARLRTDDGTVNYADHWVYLTSDQVYGAAPDGTDGLVAPKGTWQGSWSEHSGTRYKRQLRIADGDILSGGTGGNEHSWTSCSVKNRALRETTTITTYPDYDVGGFDARQLTIPAFPNREAFIDCKVVDTSKLVCENLSKGGAGPNGGTLFTFRSSVGDEVDKFTITDGADNYDPDNEYWYNCDLSNAESNTSGTAEVIIEEEA